MNTVSIKKGIRQLTEANINRIMRHGEHGFIVISANRSEIHSDNPNNDLSDQYIEYLRSNNLEDTKEIASQWLSKYNKENDQQLKKDIISSGYAFTPVFGGYHGTDNVTDSYEPSYIVYNHGRGGGIDYGNFSKLYDMALVWTKKYKQDSVYIQKPNESPIYVNGNGEQVSSSSTNDFKINRDDEMFYTTTRRDKNNPQRFTADIRFDEMYCYRGASTLNERMRRIKLGEVFLND